MSYLVIVVLGLFLGGVVKASEDRDAKLVRNQNEMQIRLEEDAKVLAMDAIRVACEDAESPLALVSSLLFPDDDCRDVSQTPEVQDKLASYLTDVQMQSASEETFLPEDETLDGNWIFYFQLPRLSDHIFFAIVPKDPSGPVRIQGFN